MGRWGPELDVTSTDAPAEEAFTAAVRSVVAQAHEQELTTTAPDPDWKPLTLAGADLARQDGLMQVDEADRLTQIIDGVQVEIAPPVKKQAQELFALLRLRDVYLELVAAQRDRPVGDEHTEELRAELNERYDAYVASYGPINRFTYKVNGQRNYPRLGGLRQDLLASRVLALEKFDPDTQVATKADIFSERTVAPPEKPQTAESAADALAISLDEFNEVRLEEIQKLLGTDTPEQAREALGTLVYTEPVTERLVPAPEYLSGNVRAKLAAAQAAAATDEAFTVNVQALTEVQPVDLTPAEIEARLGATWISAEYVQQFARELLDDPKISVENGGASYWRVSGGQLKSVLAMQTWGTTSMPAQTILQNILQNKAIKVTRTVEDADGNKRSVLDQAATEAAQAKAEEIVDRFAAWAWEDPDRARDLTRTYNAKFNSLALRTYSGEHLSFPGLSKRFVPREHQRDAVARVLSEPATLLGHGVGAGKTAEMVISVMEMRRLGQARKPAMVVPNHMLEQFSREFAELYPQANILVADKDMMSADYRTRPDPRRPVPHQPAGHPRWCPVRHRGLGRGGPGRSGGGLRQTPTPLAARGLGRLPEPTGPRTLPQGPYPAPPPDLGPGTPDRPRPLPGATSLERSAGLPPGGIAASCGHPPLATPTPVVKTYPTRSRTQARLCSTMSIITRRSGKSPSNNRNGPATNDNRCANAYRSNRAASNPGTFRYRYHSPNRNLKNACSHSTSKNINPSTSMSTGSPSVSTST